MTRRGRKRKWRDPASTTVSLEKDEYILLSALLEQDGKSYSDIFRMGSRAYLDGEFTSGNISPEFLPLYHRVLSGDIAEVKKDLPTDTEMLEQEEVEETARRSLTSIQEDKQSDELAEIIRDELTVPDVIKYRDWFGRAAAMSSYNGTIQTERELWNDLLRNYPEVTPKIVQILGGDNPRFMYIVRLAIAQVAYEETSGL